MCYYIIIHGKLGAASPSASSEPQKPSSSQRTALGRG